MRTSASRGLDVPANLRSWISASVVTIDGAAGQRTMIRAPDTATTLVVRGKDVLVLGPRTRAAYYSGKKVPPSVKIRIQPGMARSVLGIHVHEIIDRVVPLTELWDGPGARVLARLDSQHDEVLSKLEPALVERLASRTPTEQAHAELARVATAELARHTVQDTAKRLNVSERQLRSVFLSAVGIPPKRFARIDRVRAVLAHARTGAWARLATETGYADQSHLSADFRAIMGVRPSAFIAGQLPEGTSC